MMRREQGLQWGRGLSTAEISGSDIGLSDGPVASMGPRSFNRGNLAPSRKSATCSPRLQWGRGLSTAEIGKLSEPAYARLKLQWGRGLSTAEIRLGAAVEAAEAAASMGPRSFNRGNLTITDQSNPALTRFNGAAVFQPRK